MTENGYFWRYIDLESVQDLPTRYEITANYTDPAEYVGTASAYGYLADGTKYEVCRTTQYNLRPAINTSVRLWKVQIYACVTTASILICDLVQLFKCRRRKI